MGNDADICTNHEIDYEALGAIDKNLRSKYHYVIADASIYDNKSLQFLVSHSNIIVIVFEGSIACAKNVVRINNLIKKHNASCKIVYVYNKFDSKTCKLLSPNVFEKIVDEKIDLLIPYLSNINNCLVQSENVSGVYSTLINKTLMQLVNIVVTGNTVSVKHKNWLAKFMRL